MVNEAALMGLIDACSLGVLLPLAILEGPLISLLTGYLASRGAVPFLPAYLCLVAADLLGDLLLYLLGRHGRMIVPGRILRRLGLTRRRLTGLSRRFRRDGDRYLLLGKLTHSAGFAVLIAAGATHLPLARFLLINLAGSIPKTLTLLVFGWIFGESWQHAEGWILWGSVVAIAVFLGFAGLHVRLWQRAT
ncbi:MAG: VTT domain-containing protein [Paracoccaceae bacterium]|jgi:membrane protein DedA with SNARE-associated domain